MTGEGGIRNTVLVDNRAGNGLAAEHGLSPWIEAGGLRLRMEVAGFPSTGAGRRRIFNRPRRRLGPGPFREGSP